MENIETNNTIKDLIDSANKIAILPSAVAGTDAFCAGVGMYHMLKNHNKHVSFIYPWERPENTTDLIQQADIISSVKHRELIISVDYANTLADKVQYNNENGVLTLKIGPVDKNYDVIQNVRAELKGQAHDLFICVGAQMYEDYGHMYNDLERELTLGKVINLDITDRNTRFGHFNFIDPLTDSLSQLVLNMSNHWNLQVSGPAAKALLTGISSKFTQ